MNKLSTEQKTEAINFFREFQQMLCSRLEAVDGSSRFERKTWDRPEGGGGEMAVIRGSVVEKSGVNFSQVYGENYPSLSDEYHGKPFFAAGVSTITHMYNPHAPIGHMNVRLIEAGDTFWFGGGADMTPFIIYEDDKALFHKEFKAACDKFDKESYEKYSKWCDEYFYIAHRNSVRGVGGIFFDYLKGNFDEVFPFVKNVAMAYLNVFPHILDLRKNTAFSEQEKEGQLYWRGRYAEFNLIYDRGTQFGLKTKGNVEAIMVSLPPVVKW